MYMRLFRYVYIEICFEVCCWTLNAALQTKLCSKGGKQRISSAGDNRRQMRARETRADEDGLGSPIGAVAAVLFGAGRSHKNPTTIFGIENLVKHIHS